MPNDNYYADPSSPGVRGDGPLPPVQPPSARFLVQLFVVPALIVLAVVGVWALFGKIASSEEDWRELVQDVRNTNELRRWRGADGLALLLDRDQQLGESGQHLAANPEIAGALVALFEEGLARHSDRNDDLKQEAFVARTLGLLDSPGTVLPALEQGMQPGRDLEVRKNCIASVAVIAQRSAETRRPVENPALVQDLIAASADREPVIRDASTFALGLLPTSAARDRLKVLLSDGSTNTRVNAAVGLARQKSTAGYPVFTDVLQHAQPASDNEGRRPIETLLAVKNTLHAVRTLDADWTPAERSELEKLIEPISDSDPEPRIRTDAIDVLVTLKKR